MSQSYATGYQGLMNAAFPATIANGQTASAVIPMGGFTLCGIQMPAAFTGTAITFQACNAVGGTYLPMYDSVSQISYAVGPNRFVAIDPSDFQGVLFLKIISGSSEGGDRALLLSVKGF